MDEESSSSEWEPEIQNSKSIFNKIQIDFTDSIINQNVEKLLENPIYHHDDDLDPEERPIEEVKHEALYDPLDDDENSQWVNKNIKDNKNGHNKSALVCPSCFLQLAFSYKQISPKEFLVEKPRHVEVIETKVIRDRNCPEKMSEVGPEIMGKYLLERQEEFNVRIVCTCECGSDVGYFDVNKGAYILSNVI